MVERRRGRARRSKAEAVRSQSGPVTGGRLQPLETSEVAAILDAAFEILATIGMADAPEEVRDLVLAAGGSASADDRLLFPRQLVEDAVSGLPRDVVLCGQSAEHDLHLTGARVYTGTGGAAPLMLDPATDRFRPSTLQDLFDAARLVDGLDHIRFFSRSVVARDIADPLALDINTAYACLAGTRKHVMTSASTREAVQQIAKLCYLVAGSAEEFQSRPFLSLNINHVTPPLRFSPEACEVMIEAARQGIPVQVNTFGQLGASSPVTLAGCAAQTTAETLAGVVLCWLMNPNLPVVFGPRPMITDLRTGGMAGGSGEQALLTSVCVQVAQALGLPNSTIAGATDSKLPDAQAGFEKSLSVTMAAHTGANLITQSCGMLAGLMACSLEAYVIDNDMLGSIARSLSKPDVSDETLGVRSILQTVTGDGHFLGHADTLSRMQSDFLYPQVSDRLSPETWESEGRMDLRTRAKALVEDRLRAKPHGHFPPDLDAVLRDMFDIRLAPRSD